MKLHRIAALACLGLSALAHAGTQVGVNISVNQPGFYGRVELGQQPPPRVIYQQPVIIQQTPVAMVQQPIYLRVPPMHYQRWAFYCARYRACGQRVYFVDAPPVMMPRHDHWDRHHDGRDDRYDHRDERRDDRHDDRPGRGHGHGHDHRR